MDQLTDDDLSESIGYGGLTLNIPLPINNTNYHSKTSGNQTNHNNNFNKALQQHQASSTTPTNLQNPNLLPQNGNNYQNFPPPSTSPNQYHNHHKTFGRHVIPQGLANQYSYQSSSSLSGSSGSAQGHEGNNNMLPHTNSSIKHTSSISSTVNSSLYQQRFSSDTTDGNYNDKQQNTLNQVENEQFSSFSNSPQPHSNHSILLPSHNNHDTHSPEEFTTPSSFSNTQSSLSPHHTHPKNVPFHSQYHHHQPQSAFSQYSTPDTYNEYNNYNEMTTNIAITTTATTVSPIPTPPLTLPQMPYHGYFAPGYPHYINYPSENDNIVPIMERTASQIILERENASFVSSWSCQFLLLKHPPLEETFDTLQNEDTEQVYPTNTLCSHRYILFWMTLLAVHLVLLCFIAFQNMSLLIADSTTTAAIILLLFYTCYNLSIFTTPMILELGFLPIIIAPLIYSLFFFTMIFNTTVPIAYFVVSTMGFSTGLLTFGFNKFTITYARYMAEQDFMLDLRGRLHRRLSPIGKGAVRSYSSQDISISSPSSSSSLSFAHGSTQNNPNDKNVSSPSTQPSPQAPSGTSSTLQFNGQQDSDYIPDLEVDIEQQRAQYERNQQQNDPKGQNKQTIDQNDPNSIHLQNDIKITNLLDQLYYHNGRINQALLTPGQIQRLSLSTIQLTTKLTKYSFYFNFNPVIASIISFIILQLSPHKTPSPLSPLDPVPFYLVLGVVSMIAAIILAIVYLKSPPALPVTPNTPMVLYPDRTIIESHRANAIRTPSELSYTYSPTPLKRTLSPVVEEDDDYVLNTYNTNTSYSNHYVDPLTINPFLSHQSQSSRQSHAVGSPHKSRSQRGSGRDRNNNNNNNTNSINGSNGTNQNHTSFRDKDAFNTNTFDSEFPTLKTNSSGNSSNPNNNGIVVIAGDIVGAVVVRRDQNDRPILSFSTSNPYPDDISDNELANIRDDSSSGGDGSSGDSDNATSSQRATSNDGNYQDNRGLEPNLSNFSNSNSHSHKFLYNPLRTIYNSCRLLILICQQRYILLSLGSWLTSSMVQTFLYTIYTKKVISSLVSVPQCNVFILITALTTTVASIYITKLLEPKKKGNSGLQQKTPLNSNISQQKNHQKTSKNQSQQKTPTTVASVPINHPNHHTTTTTTENTSHNAIPTSVIGSLLHIALFIFLIAYPASEWAMVWDDEKGREVKAPMASIWAIVLFIGFFAGIADAMTQASLMANVSFLLHDTTGVNYFMKRMGMEEIWEKKDDYKNDQKSQDYSNNIDYIPKQDLTMFYGAIASLVMFMKLVGIIIVFFLWFLEITPQLIILSVILFISATLHSIAFYFYHYDGGINNMIKRGGDDDDEGEGVGKNNKNKKSSKKSSSSSTSSSTNPSSSSSSSRRTSHTSHTSHNTNSTASNTNNMIRLPCVDFIEIQHRYFDISDRSTQKFRWCDFKLNRTTYKKATHNDQNDQRMDNTMIDDNNHLSSDGANRSRCDGDATLDAL